MWELRHQQFFFCDPEGTATYPGDFRYPTLARALKDYGLRREDLRLHAGEMAREWLRWATEVYEDSSGQTWENLFGGEGKRASGIVRDLEDYPRTTAGLRKHVLAYVWACLKDAYEEDEERGRALTPEECAALRPYVERLARAAIRGRIKDVAPAYLAFWKACPAD